LDAKVDITRDSILTTCSFVTFISIFWISTLTSCSGLQALDLQCRWNVWGEVAVWTFERVRKTSPIREPCVGQLHDTERPVFPKRLCQPHGVSAEDYNIKNDEL